MDGLDIGRSAEGETELNLSHCGGLERTCVLNIVVVEVNVEGAGVLRRDNRASSTDRSEQ